MRARWVARAASLVALGVASCEVLVDGDLHAVHCQDEGAAGPPACPAGSACVQGTCARLEDVPKKLGSPCAGDADCAPGHLCIDPAAWGGSGARACSIPCCSTKDCGEDGGEGFVCWPPPLGSASFCRAADAVGRGALGAGEAATPCSDGSACRSGLCVDGACVDGCCSDTNCAGAGAVCRLRPSALSAAARWVCAASQEKKPALSPCAADDECSTALCTPIDGQLLCAAPCCASATCDELPDGSPLACVELARGGGVVRACAAVLPKTATGAVGRACHAGAECRSGLCAPTAGGEGKGMCVDTCCTDASCGDPSFVCRPAAAQDGGAGAWTLRCAMK
jgi:hypothetical protein